MSTSVYLQQSISGGVIVVYHEDYFQQVGFYTLVCRSLLLVQGHRVFCFGMIVLIYLILSLTMP